MATAPATVSAKRKQTGPRTVKPKTIILGYKGQLDGDLVVFPNADAALDAKSADPAMNIKRFTLPKGKSRKPADDGTGSQVNQAA